MKGWKTWAAGIAAIAYGIFGLINGSMEQGSAADFIFQGLAIIGLGHKIEKISS